MSQNQEQLSISTMRCLAADVVQGANSGHPGMPIGMSPTTYVLFKNFVNLNTSFKLPKDKKKMKTNWLNRDRVIFSGGHGSALLYTLLHLSQFDVSIEDLKQFRQNNSKTPGHPEFGHTPGVEATTGPLGQGIANSVGLAMAEKNLAARFNKSDMKLIDHFVYCLCGDGDLMEGVSLEAIAIAGHQKLGNLVLIYDDNQITIDGATNLAFTEDISKLFEAYNWDVQTVKDGNTDLTSIKNAIEKARKTTDKPSLIRVKTTIGYGSIKEGTSKVHGSPLGDEGVKKLKEKFGLNPDLKYQVDKSVYDDFSIIKKRGDLKKQNWEKLLNEYKQKYPKEFKEFNYFINDEISDKIEPEVIKAFEKYNKTEATRKSSGAVLNVIGPLMNGLIGGSADLTPSNNTAIKSFEDFSPKNYSGRYIRWGVREHGMCAVANGISLYGGFTPYIATFLVFAGYGLGAIRVAALSNLGVIYVFTHDSIFLGEDGPTHQPVETIPTLRTIPNLLVFRPADAREVAGSYLSALKIKISPSMISLSRQNLPQLKNSSVEKTQLGGYVIHEEDKNKKIDCVLVATGSEVSLCCDVAEKSNKNIRVVSIPCLELFEKQSEKYKKTIIPENVPVLAVEASIMMGWEKYSHMQFGMKSFGASAPAKDLAKKFGFTVENINNKVDECCQKYQKCIPKLNF